MATDVDAGDSTLDPEDAFAVLGNETRMEILQLLSDTDEPLSFSELRGHVGIRDSGQFNYHLDKLVGHFVKGTDDGYTLRRAGERVIEAVLSGAVTETPVLEPTTVDWPCHHCGAPTEVSFRQEWLALSCTECAGAFGESMTEHDAVPEEQRQHGFLGGLPLPPAGVTGRTAFEVVQAANIWGSVEVLMTANGTCPRCSATVDSSVSVCEDHDATDGLCSECDFRYMVHIETNCINCPYTMNGASALWLVADTDFLNFVTGHGIDPISRSADFYRATGNYEEELLSTDPFEARFTWSIDDDTLTLTVDDDLTVVDVTRSTTSGTV